MKDVVHFEEDFPAGRAVVVLVGFFWELRRKYDLTLVETQLGLEAGIGTHVGTYTAEVIKASTQVPVLRDHNKRQSHSSTPRHAHKTVNKDLPPLRQCLPNESIWPSLVSLREVGQNSLSAVVIEADVQVGEDWRVGTGQAAGTVEDVRDSPGLQ